MNRSTLTNGPLVLVVLDGWGLREERDHNAIKLARTPAYTELLERFPHSSLSASGEAVGLPVGQMGNSEVGHTTMGAGRVIYQDLTRIDDAVASGALAENESIRGALDSGRLHLLGLVSDGGVHASLDADGLVEIVKAAAAL
jgi:2,3-bisphosphoglycerate-independent phosphoglycerate mutase